MCDFFSEGECVPTFACESERGPFVREVEKRNEERLGDKVYGGSFVRFSPSTDSGGSQRTGKCMYIKARRNQGLQMAAFRAISLAAQSRAVFAEGKARVSPCKPLCAIL